VTSIVSRRETNGLDWNWFVDTHELGCWWQRQEWLDYCMAYDPTATDLSFAVVEDDRIVGICPALEREGQVRMGDDPCAGLLVQSEYCAVLLSAMQERLAGLSCAWRWNCYPFRSEMVLCGAAECDAGTASWPVVRVAMESLSVSERDGDGSCVLATFYAVIVANLYRVAGSASSMEGYSQKLSQPHSQSATRL